MAFLPWAVLKLPTETWRQCRTGAGGLPREPPRPGEPGPALPPDPIAELSVEPWATSSAAASTIIAMSAPNTFCPSAATFGPADLLG